MLPDRGLTTQVGGEWGGWYVPVNVCGSRGVVVGGYIYIIIHMLTSYLFFGTYILATSKVISKWLLHYDGTHTW